MTAGKEEYDLVPFFHAPLRETDAVAFRHDVFQDLENPSLFDAITAFAHSMHVVREHLAQLAKPYGERQKERWSLDAVDVYCAGGRSRLSAGPRTVSPTRWRWRRSTA